MAILLAAATDMEMQAFTGITDSMGKQAPLLYRLVTGIGPVETALSLSCLLQRQSSAIDWVLNFGIAGAYPEDRTAVQAGLLDICLAEQEVIGDLGIQLADRVERFGTELPVRDRFVLDQSLLAAAEAALQQSGMAWKKGIFVTVNCASGTAKRGRQLGRQFCGLCENMEGAAVARVCEAFALPCLEVRCVSNMVEDRNRANWKLQQACRKAGQAAAAIIGVDRC
ncbi:MAG: futalosine hydrolase [Candidatus Electrothrix sp. YB6]